MLYEAEGEYYGLEQFKDYYKNKPITFAIMPLSQKGPGGNNVEKKVKYIQDAVPSIKLFYNLPTDGLQEPAQTTDIYIPQSVNVKRMNYSRKEQEEPEEETLDKPIELTICGCQTFALKTITALSIEFP